MTKILLFILTIIAIMSLYEVFTTNNGDTSTDYEKNGEFHEFDENPSYSEEAQKLGENEALNPDLDTLEIRAPQMGSEKFNKLSMNYPTIRFLFCVSCGYKQAFDQFSQILKEKYPGLHITGENYPPPTLKSLLSQVVGFGKIILIVMIVMGRDPFQSLGIQTPALFTWMLNNRFSSCLMLFLLSNSIGNNYTMLIAYYNLEAMLMSTGAFEIYLGNVVIWSKLESGRVPAPPELFQAIEAHMNLNGEFKDSISSEGFIFSNDH